MLHKPVIRAFFDEPTNTVSYIVADPDTKKAAVMDPVLDYEPSAGQVDTRSVDTLLRVADEQGYMIVWTLETHAHAPTICPVRLTSRPRRARRSASASTSGMCSESSGRFSTPPISR